jgi:uncharacterized protein involved in type VI secretion and phage assembly
VTASLLELLSESGGGRTGSRITGAVIGLVTNNNDPDGLSRVKVKFPWLSASDESYWARVAAPMAGNDRGIYFLPEVDDEVLVMFEHGDVRFPFVIGSLWNGQDKSPANNADGKNAVRVIKSRSGHVIKLNDEDGKETLEIIDASTKNSIVIDTATNTITITADQDIVLAAPNGAIKLDAKTIITRSAEKTEIRAGKAMEVVAQSHLKLAGQDVDIN